MSKFSKGLVVAVTLIACVAMAGAQGQGQGGGAGRQGGRGGGQRGGRGGGMTEMSLAMRHDVQVDLAVTDDQKTKIEELNTKQREAMRAQFGGGGGAGAGGNGGGGNGGGQVDREAMQKRMEEMRATQHKDLAAILNDGQMKRLDEILIQLQGNRAILQADTQKALGLSADQIQKIKDLQTKQQEANTSLREKQRNNEMTREEVQAAQQKNNTAMNDELGKILTSDQAAKLKAMGGKEFKADPPAGGGN